MNLDLDDWLAGRKSWLTLFDLLEQLPQDSAYRAALLEDEDIARATFAELQGQRLPKAPPPKFHGYSREVEQLQNIEDALRAFMAAFTDSGFRPSPRPETAFNRVKKEYVSAGLRSAVSQLIPRGN